MEQLALLLERLGTFPCLNPYNGNMKLKPLQQWICDKCGGLIEKPSDGWLEWLGDGATFKHSGFKIVHHSTPEHRKGEGGATCYHYSGQLGCEDGHLEQYIGTNGMAEITAWVYSPGVKDLEEWAEVFRRLHIPHYEEARQYWQEAENDGAFAETDPSCIYTQSMLTHVIATYGQTD
jgi:hypothetical protein